MSDVILELKDVMVGYDKKSIIEPCSFNIKKGEVLVLLGPNGSGKSTILKSISRQLKLLGGKIAIAQKDIRDYSWKDFAKEVSILSTEKIKPEIMTCYDVVATSRLPHTGWAGILREDDNSAIRSAIDLFDLSSIAALPFNTLSDGQKQRTLIARAVCQEAEIIILDEPTSYLDIKYKLKVLEILRDLALSGKTVILSLHEIDMAQKIADHILFVGSNKHKIESVDESYKNNSVQDFFLLKESSYDSIMGASEMPCVKGDVKTFVISSGGKGIPIYRFLQRKRIPFASGILYKNDIDYFIAQKLSCTVVSEEPFMEISDTSFFEAYKLIESCDRVINAGVAIGTCNKRIKELLDFAESKIWHIQ